MRTRQLHIVACWVVAVSFGFAMGRPKKAPPPVGPRFEISFPASIHPKPIDGRVLVIVSTDAAHEPRFEVGDHADTQQLFGIDADGWNPGQPIVLDNTALGYPLDSTNQIRPGDYTVQAVVNLYTTFHRGDGRVVKLPMDEGEGQQWNRKPGNLYSSPARVHLDAGTVVHITLTRTMPAIPSPPDTRYIRHIRVASALLTRFWGRPMYLGAIVLLPEGWDSHPAAHYPLVVYQGHFQNDFGAPVGFRPEPPTPGLTGPLKLWEDYSYKFYQDWTSGRLPHVILLIIQHANPYYDDSYAVNSANIGPYGDAITQELIPEVERRYRGIGQGWARALYGGSTGGWEAAGMQVFYPDFFNGAWCSCPDPVDFRAYQIVNLYDDPNAFWLQGPWGNVPRPAERRADGTVLTTMDRTVRRELVLGTHGRSGDQFDAWQAVFSPVGADGYPAEIFDQRTGEIHHDVALYWRDHYDLRYIMQRDWKTLGPKLVGKLHFTVGARDSFYLDNAARLLQKFLETTTYPYYHGDFDFGPQMPHCYFGDPALPRRIGALTTPERVLPKMAERFEQSAPAGADMSWKY
jgi:hypothetical protein